MHQYRGLSKELKGLQYNYNALLLEVVKTALDYKLMARRNPFITTTLYAEAVDNLLLLLPIEAKQELAEHGIDVDTVISEAMQNCERPPYIHPYVTDANCLSLAKQKLDQLLRALLDIGHEHGLFLIERRTQYRREGA